MLIGVVGKPNAGKSTFFKSATLAEAEIASYPFVTIKPNEGIGFVRVDCADRFFHRQCHPRNGFCLNGQRFVPVELIDVAGLVPDAHKGKGMGNQFLDDLRQADVLVHVIDLSGSTNEKGEVIETGKYNPADDIRFLEVELDMWYLGILKKGWERFARTVIQEKKEIHLALGKQLSGLKVTEDLVEEVIAVLNLNKEKPNLWTEEELGRLATELRKRTKPMIIAGNKVDVPVAKVNFSRLQKEFPDYQLVACSAESELALREAARAGLIEYVPGNNSFKILKEEKLNEKQKKALQFIKEQVLDVFGSTGVQGILNQAVFNLLGYITIFPGGVNKLEDSEGRVLPDCFLMPPETTALDFAYRLHTDFGKHFIRAIDVKSKRTVGKDYPLKNGDVIEIIVGK